MTINRHSGRLSEARAQVGSRAMLFATGLTEDDLPKAQVGIASTWVDGNPCNVHQLDLGTAAGEGVRHACMVGATATASPSMPQLRGSQGVLFTYIRSVSTASLVCMTDG